MIFAYFINLIKWVKISPETNVVSIVLMCSFPKFYSKPSHFILIFNSLTYSNILFNTTKINNSATISGPQISLFVFPLKNISLLHILPHSSLLWILLNFSKFPWSCLLKITHFYDFWFYLFNERISLGKWKEDLLLVTKFHALVFFPVNISRGLRNENNK